MPGIKVYTTEPCPFCRQAKALLDARGLTYDEVNLSKDPAGRAQLAEKTGMMTFPQVIVGDELVGGFDALRAADKSGALKALLAA